MSTPEDKEGVEVSPRESGASPPWLAGGGEMGALMRSIDWSRTPVGPPETWPPALRTMLSVLLPSQHPMFIYWGRELVQFYNDAYRPILGSKMHPAAMGQLGRECWRDVWPILEPMMDKVWEGGATYVKDGLLLLERHGFPEECYFDYAYTPIRDESGKVAGIFVPCGETTVRMLSERRLKTLGDLSASTSNARGAEEACRLAIEILGGARSDVPFALIYTLDDDDATARLAGCMGLEVDHPAAPAIVQLRTGTSPWPLERARLSEVEVPLSSSPALRALPGGPWPEAPTSAVVLPLLRGAEGRPCGYFVAGVSPRLILDDAYRSFLRLVAGHISSAIQNAKAYADEKNRAEKLAELDRAKTAFFSNVSHELRTPLALILGPTERLLEDPDLPAPWRHELEVVTRNGRTLIKHVNDLLEVARLEAGKAALAYAEADLAGVLRLVVSHFEILAREKEITFRIEADESVPAQIDSAKVQRVLLNLLSNAFKFTPVGGLIRCTLRVEPAEPHAVLEVADSGPGIPPGERELVFERFRQLEGGATRRFGGTGLGLAITREFVELHGGTVAVSDAPEGGALFTVNLPVHAPEGAVVGMLPDDAPPGHDVARQVLDELRQPPTMPSASGSPTDARTTILVVEDNVEMNQFIRQSLGKGYRFLTAFDGEEGLRIALDAKPDLIVTDVMMPKMSGDELVRSVRQLRALDSIPIVVLTAKADEELRVALLREGAQDYLFKPFSADELCVRVRNLIDTKRARDTLQQAFASQTEGLEELSLEVVARRRDLELALEQLREKEKLQRFLASATAMLAESLDYRKTIARVASLAVPVLADWSLLELLDEDRTIRRVEVAHADPEHAGLAQQIMRFASAPDQNPEHPGSKVLLTGAPVLIGEVTEAEMRRIAQDDDHFAVIRATGAVSVMAVPLVAHGRTLGLLTFVSAQSGRRYRDFDLVVAQDVARRCALAMDNARLFQESRGAIAARDEFLSIASHELRTPLTPLQLQVQTLERRSSEFVKEEKHAWFQTRLATILRQSRRLDRLVTALLDISRIISGRLLLELEDVDLAAVVQAAAAEAQEQAGVEGRTSELRIEIDDEAIVGRWDRTRVEQVVSNLLSNALKFGEGQPISISVAATDGDATLAVRDGGVGIDPGDQQRIFGRFERAVSARNYGGLGLGLFIVRQVVEAMGGSIRVVSQRGQGAAFFVTLPLAGPAPVVGTAHRDERSQFH